MSRPPPSPGDAGPIASARALGATLLEILHTRIELAVVELQEEGQRRKEMLVLAAVAGAFLALAALLLAAFVVVLFWDSHRVLAAGAVTAAYLGVGLWALARLRSQAREAPPPFEATLAELAKDVETLRGRDV
jgi:uncharacterized membrane protein YqjE